MKITRKSMISGKILSREIDVTKRQLNDWQSGTFIQVAMPHLTADEREFIMTGIPAEEWNKTFGEESGT